MNEHQSDQFPTIESNISKQYSSPVEMVHVGERIHYFDLVLADSVQLESKDNPIVARPWRVED